jgi:haloalkane dehalogenase
MRALIFDSLDLGPVTLVGQDWGALFGLRPVAEHPERFARVVAANTGLPTGDRAMPDAFLTWQKFSQEVPQLPIGPIVSRGYTSSLAPEVVAAYDAPFPDESLKEGARQFASLVPATPDGPAAPPNRVAWEALTEVDDALPHRLLRRALPHRLLRRRAELARVADFVAATTPAQ